MNKAIIFAIIFLSFISHTNTQSQTQDHCKDQIKLHCNFDKGSVTTSIPTEQLKNVVAIILARFGLILLNAPTPVTDKEGRVKEIIIEARENSYSGYLAHFQKKCFHHQNLRII